MAVRKKNKGGRPKIDIDWDLVDNLAAIHCTVREICQVTGISEDTLCRACKREHKMTTTDYVELKRGKGKASVRRKQYQLAMQGDKTMLVWLGKNWLNQTDKLEQKTEHSGNVGPVILPDNGRDKK